MNNKKFQLSVTLFGMVVLLFFMIVLFTTVIN